ncbi:hypothetical protein SCUCBS95973_007947 [Sporothrix curviconia]|uniref:Uncharacterized protein n=1 Tax=Sporothrix curviconia TaxID=1260050 RepID=A0ABP0CKC6_9PEZI
MAAYANDDPDAGGRLLAPPKRKRHQVRVQGRLVLVRSVSAVNLASPPSSTGTAPLLPSTLRGERGDPGVGSVVGGSSSSSQQKTRRNTRRTAESTARRQSCAGPDTNPACTEAGLFLGDDDVDHDGAVDTSASDTEEDEQETALRDRQRRGYGIGGAGNIRRPTEVVQFYSSSSMSSRKSRADRRWQWMSSLLANLRGKKESE